MYVKKFHIYTKNVEYVCKKLTSKYTFQKMLTMYLKTYSSVYEKNVSDVYEFFHIFEKMLNGYRKYSCSIRKEKKLRK